MLNVIILSVVAPWNLFHFGTAGSANMFVMATDPPIYCSLGWAGLGWAGLGWAGLGWAGLGWAGLGWAGLGWAGLAQSIFHRCLWCDLTV
jgi:hypothetical protein